MDISHFVSGTSARRALRFIGFPRTCQTSMGQSIFREKRESDRKKETQARAMPCSSRAYRMGGMIVAFMACSSGFMAALITSIPSVSPVQRVSWARSLQRQLPGSQGYLCVGVLASHCQSFKHDVGAGAICTRTARHFLSRCCWANSAYCRVSWKAVGRGPKDQDVFAVSGFSSASQFCACCFVTPPTPLDLRPAASVLPFRSGCSTVKMHRDPGV